MTKPTSATERYIAETIRKDSLADKKITFITGPRQVGKTTLAKTLLESSENYKSWDSEEFKKAWIRSPSESLKLVGPGPILLDEIHKDKKKWKNRIKGLYDTGLPGPLIVTGSARLDVFRKGSDSLMGRYIPYRVHPFSVGECKNPPGPHDVFEVHSSSYSWNDILNLSGFPEPLLGGIQEKAVRWSRLRTDQMIDQDIRDEKAIQDIQAFKNLVSLLPERTSGQLSLNSIREDVGVAYATARAWVGLLHDFYFCFSIKPFSRKVKRSLVSEPKMYFFDVLRIPNTRVGQRHENAVALHLLKACHFWTDSAQGEFDLFYVKDKEKREVDFLVTKDRAPWLLLECKSNNKQPTKSLLYFKEQLKPKFTYQLVTDLRFHKEYAALGVTVVSAEKFFKGWV
jgi:predicted AAA+ superfamily ATPase